jgi:hypothetical protein
MRFPKTKSEYVAAHKKLWNEIIKRTQNTKQTPNDLNELKQDICQEFWPDKLIINNCFGCDWPYDVCLFKTKLCSADCDCLDGLWEKILKMKNVNEFIKLAKAIRDFPVR